MYLLQQERAFLYSHPEMELSEEQVEAYRRLLAERASGRPTQYITGHQEFWGLDFEVSPAVLIPRPETELLVETLLDLIARQQSSKSDPFRIVDVGTGSGCIALALASELPQARLFAFDVSPAALTVARKNAVRLKMANRVEFIEGDLLAPFLNPEFLGTFDFVVSNPPYVGHDERAMVQREVRDFEPALAWGDLAQGEEIYARLFPQSFQALRPGGYAAVEIGYNKKDAVLGLLGAGWTAKEARPDLAGIPRVVLARKND